MNENKRMRMEEWEDGIGMRIWNRNKNEDWE